MPQAKTGNPKAEQSLMDVILAEIESVKHSMSELKLLLDQSQAEIGRLTQRNAVATSQVQQLSGKLESTPREDIQAAYSTAMDTQQRLLVLRGQSEKVQSEYDALDRHFHFLQSLIPLAEAGALGEGHAGVSLALVVNALETEKARISRHMNDGPAQALSNFIVQSEIVEKLFTIDPVRAKAELDVMKDAALQTFHKIRDFIAEIRPIIIDEQGVVTAIKRFIQTYKDQTKSDIVLAFEGTERRLDSAIEIFTFRSVQELLKNAVAFNSDIAGKLKISISIVLDDQTISVEVEDNGKGILEQTLENSPGVGLKTLKDRVLLQGGTFDLKTSPDNGVRVSWTIPC